MRLWTVQGEDHWRKSIAKGRLTGGEGQQVDPSWRPAYEWMRQQMATQLSGYSGEFPVWAWLKSPVGRLRYSGGWGSLNERMVLLVLEIPEARVITSSFNAWHAVLNERSVETTEEGEDAPGVDKVTSWRKIFNPTDPATRDWGAPPCIQACVDGVNPQSEVLAATRFSIEAA